MSAEVASLLRRELIEVVERGTGRRAAGGIRLDDGRLLAIGGKTGTGDNRFETVSAVSMSSRVVNRTAAFAFTIGDRYFGTAMAYVPGAAAAASDFHQRAASAGVQASPAGTDAALPGTAAPGALARRGERAATCQSPLETEVAVDAIGI